MHPRVRSLEEDLELAASGKLNTGSVKLLGASSSGKASASAAPSTTSEDVSDGRRRVRFQLPEDFEESDSANGVSQRLRRPGNFGEFEDANDDPFARLTQQDRRSSIPELLHEIQEKDTVAATKAMFLPPKSKDRATPAGFPKTFIAATGKSYSRSQRSTSTPSSEQNSGQEPSSGPRRKVSLFKQMMMEKRGEDASSSDSASSKVNYGATRSAIPLSVPRAGDLPSQGEGDMNNQRIHNMSPAQIAEAQAEIRAQFDPEVLSRFMKKISGGEGKQDKAAESAESGTTDAKKESNSKLSTEARIDKLKDLSWIRSEEQLDEAINMLPAREKEKLRWTGRITEPSPFTPIDNDDEEENLAARAGIPAAGSDSLIPTNFRTSIESARFDLEGNFLAPTSEAPAHSALYHHGEEPERAGYTIIELTQLARSKAASQKALALSCIAKILQKRHISLYGEGTSLEDVRRDLVVNGKHPLFSLPDQLGVILRMAMDSSNPTVACAALEAMESFLVPSLHLDAVFETAAFSLGRFLPSELPRAQGAQDIFAKAFDTEPISATSSQEQTKNGLDSVIEDEDAMEDSEALVKSPVAGLVQIGLLERVRFLLRIDRKLATGVEIGPDGEDRCISILTTIALHSSTGAFEVARVPGLLEWLVARLNNYLEGSSTEISETCLRLAYVLSLSKREFAMAIADSTYESLESRVLRGGPRLARDLLRSWRAMSVTPGGVPLSSDSYVIHGAAAGTNEEQVGKSTIEIWGGRASMEAFMCVHGFLRKGRPTQDDIAADLAHFEAPDDAPADIGIANRNISEILAGVQTRLEAILPELLDEKSLVIADETLLLLDLLWQLVQREDARSHCFKSLEDNELRSVFCSVLEMSLPDELEAAKESNTPSPTQICLQRTFTMLWLRVIQILIRVYGYVDESELEDEGFCSSRRALLAEALPAVNPRVTGEEWAVAEILEALFSPKLGLGFESNGCLALKTPIVACLGGERAVEASRKLLLSGLGTGVIGETLESSRLAHYRSTLSASAQKADLVLGRRWQESRSAWSLLPLFVAFRPEGPVVVPQALAITHQLLLDGAVGAEDIILTVARILSNVEAPAILDTENVHSMARLVNDALLELTDSLSSSGVAENVFDVLQDAAGGKAALMKLWEGLIAAFNERLNGHDAAAALLLLMLETKSDRDLRLIVWSEMADANLLRLLQPSADVNALAPGDFCEPEETWDEIIQCVARSLCSNILTKQNNPFLYEIALHLLAKFFLLHKSSWNRRRILKMLVLEGPFKEVLTCPVDEENRIDKSTVHPNAAAALRAVSREDDIVRAKIAITFPEALLQEEEQTGPTEVY